MITKGFKKQVVSELGLKDVNGQNPYRLRFVKGSDSCFFVFVFIFLQWHHIHTKATSVWDGGHEL